MTALRLPEISPFDPMQAPPLRWGILAPGGIAAKFVSAMQARTRQSVVACGSRSVDRARAFADRFGSSEQPIRAHGSYQELVADPQVDVIYVASPHSAHLDHSLLAIRAGKAVLVEKAFARNTGESQQIVDEAKQHGVFCMEAMWSQFLPRYQLVLEAVRSGLLGTVHSVDANHEQLLYPNGPQRLWDPALAGGAMLDLTVYPLSLASLVLPNGPETIQALGILTESGVDANATVTVRTGGSLATCTGSMVGRGSNMAVITGDKARLELPGWFYQPGDVRLITPDDQVRQVWQSPTREHGLAYEAAEVARCVSTGRIESPARPLAETLRVMSWMDQARAQLGVRFPGEAA